MRMTLSALGGMGAATVCHPIDVVRINMQVHQYKGSVDAVRTIVRQSGLFGGLYPGIDAAYLRQWTYGSCRMGIYSFLLEKVQRGRKERGETGAVPFTTKLGMGLVSGGIGSFVGNPCELAMVRLSADKEAPIEARRNYKNVVDCMVRVAREEGITALWIGATPTVTRAMLLSATVLATYSDTKIYLSEKMPDVFKSDSVLTMFVGTSIASVAANIICTPFDVVKSRMQNMPQPAPGQPPMYKNMFDCAMQGIKAEGPTVLYRGFTPALIKLAPYTTISLILTEKLTKLVTGSGSF